MNPLRAVDLFVRPRKFFSREEIYDVRGVHIVLAWLVGMSATADQIDKKLLGAQVSGKVNKVAELAADSWVQYWGVLAAFGIVGGFFAWYAGGWWFRKRLEFSGASNVDPNRARKAYVYQSLVYDAPALCVAGVQTLLFPSYLLAWQSDETWSALVAVSFYAISCWTGYVAATTSFPISGWRAALWFLVLPVGFFLLAFGLVSHLLGMAS